MSRQKRIHDLELEQFVLNELTPEKAADVRRRLDEDPSGMQRLADIHSSNAVILEEYPPHLMAAQIRERAKSLSPSERSSRTLKLAIPALATAAVAVALVLILVPAQRAKSGVEMSSQQVDAPAEAIRIKGSTDPQIFIFRKQSDVGPDKSQLLRHQDKVRAGDVLQIRYAARGARHGVIISIDGNGSVTLHFPNSKTGSTALVQKGAEALDYAYELDKAPRFERFFFITSESEAIDVEAVLRAAKSLGPQKNKALVLPGGLNQTDVLLLKE